MKTCKKCQGDKELTAFYNKKSGAQGVGAVCKECILSVTQTQQQKEVAQVRKTAYYRNNQQRLLADKKQYRENNKEKVTAAVKKYKEQNTRAVKEYAKTYREANRDNHREYMRAYFQNNKERLAEYYKQRKINNPLFKLSCSIRTLISTSFTNNYTKKAKRTNTILGCSFEEFRLHIEQRFTAEMTWDNYGSYWELDHIKPISLAKDEHDLYSLNHYTNFQPLYWRDNLNKSNKYGSADLC